MSDTLTSFWIVPHGAVQTHGFGVTAFCIDDALHLLRDAGHDLADTSGLDIRGGVRPADLDRSHIYPNCGPAVVRGVWYRFTRVGV